MRRMTRLVGMVALAVLTTGAVPGGVGAQRAAATSLSVPGLTQPVEVIRDRWGLNHIYAQNEVDLFVAQGYLAAKDRLFQFEVWRRRATGTVAEILGPRELKRDLGTRLHMYRGDLDAELQALPPARQGDRRGLRARGQRLRGRGDARPGVAADRVQDARHHPRQVDAAGGDLPSPGADLERAQRGDARARHRRAGQRRQAARAAAHRGRRTGPDARPADRSRRRSRPTCSRSTTPSAIRSISPPPTSPPAYRGRAAGPPRRRAGDRGLPAEARARRWAGSSTPTSAPTTG